MPEESTKGDSVSNTKIRAIRVGKDARLPQAVIDKFGYTKPQDELRIKHPSGATVKLNLAMYEVFRCKLCHQNYILLLPKDAVPCPLHSEGICCSCCMRNGTSNYCIDKKTSYVVPQ